MANTKMLLGIVAGLAAGVLAGILLAPDSGVATRRKLLGQPADMEDALDDAAEEFSQGIKNAGSKLKKGGDAVKEKVDQKYEQWKDNLKNDF